MSANDELKTKLKEMVPETVSIDSYGGLHVGTNNPDLYHYKLPPDALHAPDMISKNKDPSKTLSNTNIPEVYSYNVVFDQDPDILNQGSISHIQRYFDRKERESHASTDVADNIVKYNMTSKNKLFGLSVNSVHFFIKAVAIILFLWIMWDFIDQK